MVTRVFAGAALRGSTSACDGRCSRAHPRSLEAVEVAAMERRRQCARRCVQQRRIVWNL